MAVAVHQRLALALELPRHLVEQPAQRCDLVIAVLFGDLHVKITTPDPFRRPGEPPDRARQPFGKPQSQPDSGQDQDQRKTKVDQAKVEQKPAAFAFQLVVKLNGFLRFIQKRQDRAVNLTRDIEIAVGKAFQRHQRPKLVVGPVGDQDGVARARKFQVFGRRGVETEKIGPLATGLQRARTIDKVGLFQPALDHGLALAQQLPKLVIPQKHALLLGAVKKAHKRGDIGGKIVTLHRLIGLSGRKG